MIQQSHYLLYMEMKSDVRVICTHMFIAALVIIAKVGINLGVHQ
jgi:hypothetical protein